MLLCIPNVLTANEVAKLVEQLQSADCWEEGRRTAGAVAAQVKHNRQWMDGVQTGLSDFVLNKVQNNPEFISATLPKTILPPKFNAYTGGEHYGLHVDSALMHHPVLNESMRCDISATLFLCNPESYEGGELQIETPFGAQSIKLEAGSLVLYPSSSLHQVTPVTQGQRLASFFWIQSRVQDESVRASLYDLDQTIQVLRSLPTVPQEECLRLTGVYHNLLRRWVA
ncbi:MAG: Fe2+-dependent dioxygenase [Limnobacter sp.]|nr:Fe2+-dependent dioxygenase [Limnobacter sp.]